ncbi:hypothetical protein D9611_007851 [Ephemerocybe angulata]|uniref:Uncharacterized protein n=1 Tax=Ephemerocybe angulata TaxID=980116 RepID=A0A8H5CEL5_9AGAR|nr:hypothetical protein D9611_007851 [Tulosesus angulatus]
MPKVNPSTASKRANRSKASTPRKSRQPAQQAQQTREPSSSNVGDVGISYYRKGTFASNEALVDLRRRFNERNHGDQWLWDACNEHIFVAAKEGVWVRDLERWLNAALTKLPRYPRRISPPETPSPSFQALKDVLSKAPERGWGGFPHNNEENARTDDSIGYPEDHASFWSQEYFAKVYQALMDIIISHGTGPEGWGSARWLVYDQYRKWEGFSIDDDGVYDGAFDWLRGRLPNERKISLNFGLDEKDKPPPIWATYNALLPTGV